MLALLREHQSEWQQRYQLKRIGLHSGRNSSYLYVYETQRGGRSQSARGFRVDQEGDLPELVELLLAAHRNLLRSGTGLDWRRLNLPPGKQPSGDCGHLQTWGEIRALIKADIAPGGPKAKDRNIFSCFSDKGYFGRTFDDSHFVRTEDLELFCLHTPASLDAHRRHHSQPLVQRQTNTSSFYGVGQMVNYLARRGISIATARPHARTPLAHWAAPRRPPGCPAAPTRPLWCANRISPGFLSKRHSRADRQGFSQTLGNCCLREQGNCCVDRRIPQSTLVSTCCQEMIQSALDAGAIS